MPCLGSPRGPGEKGARSRVPLYIEFYSFLAPYINSWGEKKGREREAGRIGRAGGRDRKRAGRGRDRERGRG